MSAEAQNETRTVFLTGMVRCGSSWAGHVLGAGQGTRYVYEPLNPRWNSALAPDWHQFTYLRADEEPPPSVVKSAQAAFRGRQGLKGYVRAAYRGYLWSTLRPARRILVKDPTACLAAAWLQRRFNPRMILVTRHPCGFASSIHMHGWRLRLLTLLRQARLMEDFLAPYEDFLRRADRDEWLRLGGYWAAVHRVLLHWWSSHPDWLQVSYESLCLTPRETFAQLASDSGLDWSAQVLDDSMTGNAEDHGDSGEIRRNTPGMPSVWRDRLSPEQSDAVLAAVRELGLDYEDGVVSAASAP